MSEILKELLRYCPYKEPEETQFYTMLRRGMGYEVECKGRDGYTVDYKDFGVFSRDSAHGNVKYMESNGCLRFNIEKDLLDSIVNQLQSLQEQRDEYKKLITKLRNSLEREREEYGDCVTIKTRQGWIEEALKKIEELKGD